MSEDQRDESPGGATTAIATASAVPTSRDRWLLAAACVAAVVTVAVLSGPNGGGTTWAEIDKYHSYFDGAVSTGSLVALPYPFLSLAPMAVAWAGGAAAWMVFACACLAATGVLLARHAWARGRPATVAYWFLGCAAATGPVALTRLEAPLSVLITLTFLTASPVVRGLLLGAAVWVKAWPVLLAAAVLRGDRRAWLCFAAVLVGLLAVGLVVFDDTLAWYTAQSARSLQVESLPATPFMVLAALSAAWESVLRGGLEAAWAVQGPGTGVVATASTALVFLTVVAAVLLCWRRRAWPQERVESATVVLVLASFCLAPVLSPQFLMSIVAVTAAVSVVRDRIPDGWPLLLAACLLTQAVYPWAYGSLVDGARWPLVLLVARQLALVAFAVVWVRQLLPAGSPRARPAPAAS